ncbi:MAG: hypothetical protein IPL55_02225 [Saprospiraceae bacterium]|jgi:hypothetical protein|nr:hypothetical protein [Saprospiraceae bacterium]MBL0024678.1 hypothetical protein [Saprospiraceae bacterium]
MNEIIVKPRSKKESRELQEFLNKMGIKYVISEPDKEDIALLNAMLENDDILPKPIADLYDKMGWK